MTTLNNLVRLQMPARAPDYAVGVICRPPHGLAYSRFALRGDRGIAPARVGEGAPSLRWRAHRLPGNELHVVLEGEVCEWTDLGGLALALAGHEVVFDFAGVDHIDTAGVVSLLRALARVGKAVAERCSPAVVRQLNRVPALSEHLTVRSVVAQIECRRCGAEQSAVLATTPDCDTATPRCTECAGRMRPVDPDELYRSGA